MFWTVHVPPMPDSSPVRPSGSLDLLVAGSNSLQRLLHTCTSFTGSFLCFFERWNMVCWHDLVPNFPPEIYLLLKLFSLYAIPLLIKELGSTGSLQPAKRSVAEIPIYSQWLPRGDSDVAICWFYTKINGRSRTLLIHMIWYHIIRSIVMQLSMAGPPPAFWDCNKEHAGSSFDTLYNAHHQPVGV